MKLFKTKDIVALRNRLTAISILTDEATLKINSDGIRLKMMDPSRVAMVDSFWAATDFEEYTKPEQEHKLAFNLIELMKLLKRAGKEDHVELSLDDKTGKISVSITGKYSRTFTMPSLEASEEEVPTPKIAFNVKAKLTSAGFRDMIDDARLVSDHVKLTADQESLKLFASGDLMSNDGELKKGSSDILMDLEVKEPGKATYSLAYLAEIIAQAAIITDLVHLEFSTDMPLKISTIENKSSSTLTWFLAPRIETE
jgi:proliferating cell nuclear antigen